MTYAISLLALGCLFTSSPLFASGQGRYDTKKAELEATFAIIEIGKQLGQNITVKDQNSPLPFRIAPPKKTQKPKKPSLFSDKNFGASGMDEGASDWNAEYEKTMNQWNESYTSTLENWNQDYIMTIEQWDQSYRDTLQKWEADQGDFSKQYPSIVRGGVPLPPEQSSLLDLEQGARLFGFLKPIWVANTAQERPSKSRGKRSLVLVEGAMSVPIRNQGSRGTCASFTGVRAMEIAMAQENRLQDLSEQYFYWLAKPKCRPCSKDGSMYSVGLEYSAAKSKANIPLEASCPYKSKSKKRNRTFHPMPNKCKKGVVKAGPMTHIKYKGIQRALKNDKPVMVVIKSLTANFDHSKGLVTYKGSQKRDKKWKNWKKTKRNVGHAVLLVGYMKIPRKYQRAEGKHCYIVANSWGTGWGKGGYSCVTQKWMDKNLDRNWLFTLNSVI